MSHMLETFDRERLSASNDDLGDALESHRIPYFPECPFELPPEEDLEFLRKDLPSRLTLKNVSYHPEADHVRGLEPGEDLDRVTAILKNHSASVARFLEQHMGHLTRDWRIGTCSFRPIEEKGRDLKPHASNELVHIDAGAYGATNGDRIFRFFVNVNPSRDRLWATKGDFESVLERNGKQAGILDEQGRLKGRIDKNLLDHTLSALVAGLAKLKPVAHVIDSSPYDRTMRKLHNFMKDDPAFRDSTEYLEELHFPPGSAWMVFTDGVSHASLEGQYAFVTTCIIPRASLRHPERAPYAVLASKA